MKHEHDIISLHEMVLQLTLQVKQLTQQVKELVEKDIVSQKTITELREENERLKKNSRNSSKPPSSDIVKPPKTNSKNSSKKKRKIGGQKGHNRHERKPFKPDEIDEIITHYLSSEDIERRGLTPMGISEPAMQQLELPKKLYRVIEHRVELYRDKNGQVVVASVPEAIQRQGLFTPGFTGLTAYLKSAGHMSFTTIKQFFGEVFKFDVSRGYLAKITTQKVSQALASPYEELLMQLQHEPILGVDETGHSECKKKMWTWCFLANKYTVFYIDKSRGSKILKRVLTETFGGIVGADYFSAYGKFSRDCHVLMQYCWAHLIRHVRFLSEQSDSRLSAYGCSVLEWIRKLFSLWHSRDSLTDSDYLYQASLIREGFLASVRQPCSHPSAKPLADRFIDDKFEDYFRFLTTAGVEPTNNLTEQAIRFVVIDRRITQGTRGERGRRWSQRAWTILATCRQQGRNVFDFLIAAITAKNQTLPAPSLVP